MATKSFGLLESREYFKKLAKDLDSFEGHLMDAIEPGVESLSEIGAKGAYDRVVLLDRIDTGAMRDNITPTVDRDGNTFMLTISDEVLNNKKNEDYDYVPDQEYDGYNVLSKRRKEPVRMMDHADNAMKDPLNQLLADKLHGYKWLENAWLNTTEGVVPF